MDDPENAAWSTFMRSNWLANSLSFQFCGESFHQICPHRDMTAFTVQLGLNWATSSIGLCEIFHSNVSGAVAISFPYERPSRLYWHLGHYIALDLLVFHYFLYVRHIWVPIKWLGKTQKGFEQIFTLQITTVCLENYAIFLFHNLGNCGKRVKDVLCQTSKVFGCTQKDSQGTLKHPLCFSLFPETLLSGHSVFAFKLKSYSCNGIIFNSPIDFFCTTKFPQWIVRLRCHTFIVFQRKMSDLLPIFGFSSCEMRTQHCI